MTDYTCARCGGRRWLLWMRDGSMFAQSCEACNGDGTAAPPEHVPYDPPSIEEMAEYVEEDSNEQ